MATAKFHSKTDLEEESLLVNPEIKKKKKKKASFSMSPRDAQQNITHTRVVGNRHTNKRTERTSDWESHSPLDDSVFNFGIMKGRKRDKEMDSEIRELFRIFDKNHDNTISSSELGKVLKCMGMQMSDEEIGVYMESLDKEGSGRIEYREFHSFMQEELKKAENPAHKETAIRSAFGVFDKESEGLLGLTEFKSAMKTLGEPLTDEELADMITMVTVNDDEKINYEEFIKIWLSAKPRSKQKEKD